MLLRVGVGLVFCWAIALLYLTYMGAWRSVTIAEREEGPFLFVYREVQGTDQRQVGTVTTDLRGQLDAAGVSGIRPFDVFQPTTTKLPNEIGFIVPEDEIAKLGSMKDATQRIIPRQRYMATEFPFRNRLSFIVGYFKVDPALAKYRKQRSYGTTLAISRNDGEIITYLQPVVPNASKLEP
jgi:hypothetical protein